MDIEISLVKLLKEVINEIGELTNTYYPFTAFKKGGEINKNYTTIFVVDKDNIKVEFGYIDENTYNISYTVNNSFLQSKGESKEKLLKIISTIYHITKKFIEEYKPIKLYIKGSTKQGKFQSKDTLKDKIYLAYIRKNLMDGWVLGRESGMYYIQKSNEK